MAEQLTPQTPDLDVWASKPCPCVVSLDKELYFTLSLLTPGQVYKWVPATYCWGITLQWTKASCPGGSSNTPRHASCQGNQDKL